MALALAPAAEWWDVVAQLAREPRAWHPNSIALPLFRSGHATPDIAGSLRHESSLGVPSPDLRSRFYPGCTHVLSSEKETNAS
jgi:hypothetical protein